MSIKSYIFIWLVLSPNGEKVVCSFPVKEFECLSVCMSTSTCVNILDFYICPDTARKGG